MFDKHPVRVHNARLSRLKPGLESTGLTVMVPGCQKNGLSSPRYIGWIGLPSSCTRLEAAMFLVQAQSHPKDCLSMLKSLQCCDVADPCQGNYTSDSQNTTSARPIGNADIACLGRGGRHQHTPMFHRQIIYLGLGARGRESGHCPFADLESSTTSMPYLPCPSHSHPNVQKATQRTTETV